VPAAELGPWLREQRRSRGWDVPQMARRLTSAAGSERGALPSKECLLVYIRRWERGTVGPSERYRLLYCRAFGIPLSQLGPDPGNQAVAAGNGHLPADRQSPGESGGPSAEAAGSPASDADLAGRLAHSMRAIAALLREDSTLFAARASQRAADPVHAAFCRGQALAFTAAAEHLCAALSGLPELERSVSPAEEGQPVPGNQSGPRH
jgi:transcriptional regulator with XRE-family HTH domain